MTNNGMNYLVTLAVLHIADSNRGRRIMSRHIDAYEVKRQIQKATEGEVDVMKMFLKAMYRIDMIPPADVRENVRGEWIRRDSRYVGWISFDCSVCGETLELDRETSNDFKYCPFCGADMRGGNNA